MAKCIMKRKYSTLSKYTIAKNCTDIDDIEFGINEVREFIRINFPCNTKLAYLRLNALMKKKEYIINR